MSIVLSICRCKRPWTSTLCSHIFRFHSKFKSRPVYLCFSFKIR